MEKSIKKAIEGGWRPTFNSLPHLHPKRDWEHIICDTLFWQCLGKAEGWGNYNQIENKEMNWKDYWHDFIDHLAEGKDINSFFEILLTTDNTTKV